ncbi:MAG: hypothetical protein KatS3mg114_0538 [Planctomycetaceae bacterium]|nr:MAG: hypothetical protein KatS3mg114_0538 [Planctomycetaceae bacterium]
MRGLITGLILWADTMAWAGHVETLAGSGSPRHAGDGGPALQAGVVEPFGLDIGPDGALYWAEFGSHVIRRLDVSTHTVTTFAGVPHQPGYRDGPAAQALFHQPHEIRFDPQGNLYISDMATHTIRRIRWVDRQVETVAGTGQPGFMGDGGPATQALLNLPISVLLEPAGGFLICDIRNHRIRQVTPDGVIHTVAGTGEKCSTPDGAPVMGTPLHGPRTLAIEPEGHVIIVLREGNAVYRWRRDTNTLHHVAGLGQSGYSGDGGPAQQARLAGPKGVALSSQGDIYLADTENHVIRVIWKHTGIIDTVVGDGQKGDGPEGDPRQCRLNRPHGVFFDRQDRLYIGDSNNHKVRRWTP